MFFWCNTHGLDSCEKAAHYCNGSYYTILGSRWLHHILFLRIYSFNTTMSIAGAEWEVPFRRLTTMYCRVWELSNLTACQATVPKVVCTRYNCGIRISQLAYTLSAYKHINIKHLTVWLSVLDSTATRFESSKFRHYSTYPRRIWLLLKPCDTACLKR
jgi:hypothetical protein